MTTYKKALLMILDGWGIGDGSERDVIATAPTPFMDYLNANYPHSQLLTCGEVCWFTRRANGELRSRTPQHRRRTCHLSGYGKNHQGYPRKDTLE